MIAYLDRQAVNELLLLVALQRPSHALRSQRAALAHRASPRGAGGGGRTPASSSFLVGNQLQRGGAGGDEPLASYQLPLPLGPRGGLEHVTGHATPPATRESTRTRARAQKEGLWAVQRPSFCSAGGLC